MNPLRAFSLLALACVASVSATGQYADHKVFKTNALTPEQVQSLGPLQGKFDFWKNLIPGKSAEIMATPDQVSELEGFLKSINAGYTIKHDSVDAAIKASLGDAKPRSNGKMNWDDYVSHDEINAYLDEIAAANDFADVVTIGQTEEGRDMNVLRLQKGSANNPIIFIEAGIHAREWIAPAVATYTIKQLLSVGENYLDQFNFHIIPCANPDGYEYSRSNDRLWRKNRGSNGGASCKGVDLNRNWGYHFAESGISFDPCQNVYCGEEAFSENESTNLRDYFNSLSALPEVAICFHSAADLWLYPYGYAYDQYPDNVDEIVELGEACVDALNAVNGQKFECINAADLYPAAGASDDWYASQKVRFVYTPELRDNGFGFLLPPQYIVPSGEEVWAAWEVIFAKLNE